VVSVVVAGYLAILVPAVVAVALERRIVKISY
jgi:hypothetical protein